MHEDCSKLCVLIASLLCFKFNLKVTNLLCSSVPHPLKKIDLKNTIQQVKLKKPKKLVLT